MLVIDCSDVPTIRNDLLVYVSDQVAAIPTLQNNKFTLSTLDDDDSIDVPTVIDAIREFLDSIGEGRNFEVLTGKDTIIIASVSGRILDRESPRPPPQEMFSCPHCGFVTKYEMELHIHMRIHYF